jgi:TetR/AcrR family transcriptional regulator, transcriptional repressor for nem operon
MARYKKGHSGDTRAAIIGAAERMIKENGYDATGVRDVMAAIGLTNGGFYAHFSRKAELQALVTDQAVSRSPALFRMLAASGLAAGDAGAIAGHYLSDARLADVTGGCPAAALVSEIGRQQEPVREAFENGAALAAAELRPVFRGAMGADTRGWAPFALLVGALALMRAMPDAGKRAEVRGEAQTALRLLAGQDKSGM